MSITLGPEHITKKKKINFDPVIDPELYEIRIQKITATQLISIIDASGNIVSQHYQ